MDKKILIVSQKAEDLISIYSKVNNIFKDYVYYFLLISNEKEELPFENSFFIQSDYLPSLDIDEFRNFICEISPSFIFSSSQLEIKSLLAMYACCEGLGMLSDITDIKFENGKAIFIKPYIKDIYANLISKTTPILVTLSSYETVEYRGSILYEPKTLKINKRYIISRKKITIKNAKEIQIAEKVIGIGRGVKKEDIPFINEFARKIGAVIGYTRAAIEEFDLDPSYQIGISGKSISPKVYIALAISGKEHHIRGVLAKTIIAVNMDPNAPIKRYADYFICEDYRAFIESVF